MAAVLLVLNSVQDRLALTPCLCDLAWIMHSALVCRAYIHMCHICIPLQEMWFVDGSETNVWEALKNVIPVTTHTHTPHYRQCAIFVPVYFPIL